MTTNEKVKFIVGDYMNAIDSIGSMPGEKILAEKWFEEQFRPMQNNFMTKYRNNSMSAFANKLAVAYGDVVEGEFKYMFTPPDLTTNN